MQCRIVSLLVSLFAAVILCGCAKSDSNPAAPGSALQIWPDAINNQWIMKYSEIDSRTDSLAFVRYETYHIDKDSIIGGMTWRIGRGGNFGPPFMANLSGGLWVRGEGGESYLYFPFPAKAGDTWRIVRGEPGYGYDTLYCSVRSLGESVSVTAGSFSCIAYRFRTPEGDAEWVFRLVPGVGPVTMEYSMIHPLTGKWVTTGRWELEDYTVK